MCPNSFWEMRFSNAIKFTLEGAVTVNVCREGPQLQFTVIDTGIGIAAEGIEEIFEEFSQAEASTTRRFGGTGLGLTISRKLTELMEGSLRVESTPGRGSQFHFHLPLLEAVGPPVSTPPTPEITSLPSSFRALIVDDNAVNLRIGVHFLSKTGRMWNRRETPRRRLHCTRRILSIHSDGLPYAGQTPILALTADVYPEVRERCFVWGMNGYLSKPLQIEELNAALRSYSFPMQKT